MHQCQFWYVIFVLDQIALHQWNYPPNALLKLLWSLDTVQLNLSDEDFPSHPVK